MDYTYRWNVFWIGFCIVIALATVTVGISYGNELRREEETQRYAIIQQQGGEPVCAGPDGVYVRFPSFQPPPGSTG